MRREMSPREVVDMNFRKLTNQCESLRKLARDSSEQLSVTLFEESLNDLHTLALSFTIEAGPANPERLAALLEKGSDTKVESFVERHLRKQAPLICVEGVDPEVLAEACMTKIKEIDPEADFDKQMAEIGTSIAEKLNVTAKSWSAYMIETVCREALGLDGRAPDERDAPAMENAKRIIRMFSGKDATPTPD
jgi:hypothetical protein